VALEQSGIAVKVIVKDEARARHVASQLERGLVLHDEGASREFLLQERVDRTDAFVAVTGDDRANLLAAMYARQLGAGLTIAGLGRGSSPRSPTPWGWTSPSRPGSWPPGP